MKDLKDYLDLWFLQVLKIRSLRLDAKVTAIGERNQHLGVEPATGLR